METLLLPLAVNQLQEVFSGAVIQVLRTACVIPFGPGVKPPATLKLW